MIGGVRFAILLMHKAPPPFQPYDLVRTSHVRFPSIVMSDYEEEEFAPLETDPVWADIEPIPQDDGPHPLAAIAYTEDYSEAMSYLRAVMAKNEMSERVLDLTSRVIELNPAHYTVW
jgi:hypothetical protein